MTTRTQHSMKCRRMLSPLLPTITETLEDSSVPTLPSSSSSQSLDEYMTSIQALARPVAPPVCGPVRLQRTPRSRLFAKPQGKHSVLATLPRGSPRTLRVSRTTSSLAVAGPEEWSLQPGRQRDFEGGDPVDWLFGQTQNQNRTQTQNQTQTQTQTQNRTQIRTQNRTRIRTCGESCLRENLAAALWVL